MKLLALTLWSCRANHSYNFLSSSKYRPEHHETEIWQAIHAPKKKIQHSNPSPDSSPPQPDTTGIYPRKWRHVKETLPFLLWTRDSRYETENVVVPPLPPLLLLLLLLLLIIIIIIITYWKAPSWLDVLQSRTLKIGDFFDRTPYPLVNGFWHSEELCLES